VDPIARWHPGREAELSGRSRGQDPLGSALGGPPHAQPPGAPILVVDDDADVRRLYSSALGRVGYETVEAENGRHALEVIASRPVALVLLDMRMPEMSGPEVVSVLRSREATRALPVIMVTGESHVADRVAGLERGADDYMTKPVHVSELVARVRAQLRSRAAWASAALERDLRERAEVAAALSRIRPGADAEETADAICAELAEVPGTRLVALVRFAGEGQAVALGWRGTPWTSPGSALPRAAATHLQRLAARGPFVQRRLRRSEDRAAAVALESIGLDGAAVAPLRLATTAPNGPEAVLILGFDRRDAQAEEVVARRLSASIDFAAVAAALLSSGLADRERLTRSRDALAEIIAERRFEPHYQPVMDLETGRVIGREALTRFADGVRPDLRFAEASRLGLGVELESAALREALEHAPGLPNGSWLSLNVSPQAVLAGVLDDLLADADRPLVIEVTEHDPVPDYGAFREALQRLDPALRLAVDDAGSGYASLQHILALQPAFVKLDMALVRDIQRDPARQAMVAGLCHFARATSSSLVAEGIEREAERDALTELEVPFGQGFLLGAPEPATAGR
jgi:EAL domain-containing protein (putative c-di-GMP-specific phosphodiesterase class I)/FixJ family two-component response regulator